MSYEYTREFASQLVVAEGVIAYVLAGAAIGGLDVRRMTLLKINFIATYTYTAQDLHYSARTIFDGWLGPLDCTEQGPLEDRQKASSSDISVGPVASQKIILSP